MLVALTGWGQEEDQRRAREAGFDHHLTKPADADQIVAAFDGVQPPDVTAEVRYAWPADWRSRSVWCSGGLPATSEGSRTRSS